MHKEVLITSQDLVDWIDRPPSNDDLDLCNYLENAVKNQYKYKNIIDKIKEKVDYYKSAKYGTYDSDDILADLNYIFLELLEKVE